MDWYSLSDPAIMVELGKRLKATRLRRNITQQELALRSGISLLSIQNLEKGQSVTLATLIKVLRMLQLIPNLDILVPESPVSPIELLKLKRRTRQRARKTQVKE